MYKENIKKLRHLIMKVPGVRYIVKKSRELRKRLFLGLLWPIQRRSLMQQPRMSLRKFMSTVLREGDVAFDIGANTGDTALLMASCVTKSGLVCAFEPIPACFTKLEQSAKNAWYRNLHAHHLALSDTSGNLTLNIDLREGGFASTIVAEHAEREATWHEARYSPISVTSTTLDAFCETSNIIPSFLKIDVEGAEEMVMRGGHKIIAKFHPLIWFECWCGTNNGAQINHNLGHFKQLSDLGYNFFLATLFKLNGGWIHENNQINPAQLLRFEPKMLEHIPAMGCDILAATNDQLGLLHKCGLISEADARNHILGFLKT